ncbi:taperin [Otolemur garnettii]|uniref:Taperin n=1 Tax=Otolemur garnettii TaxID=30611 RepID=H0Y273_OTOGA|nr:taperin [Otolemur garnettii]
MAGLGRPGPGPRTALPAWKREVLERKRAKLAALGGGADPGGGAAEPAGAAERCVLADSLGPLRENPFMRLESERRRSAAGARPLLEHYRHVPGVRTIRADNILIIEAAVPPTAPPAGTARIRASEVLVYEAPPPPGRVSRLLEKFDLPAVPRLRGSPERPRPPLPPRPPPTDPPALVGPRVGERAAHFEPVRRGGGTSSGAWRSEFLQKTGSNSFTVHPRGLQRGAGVRKLSNGPAAPGPRVSPANGLAGSPPGPDEWKPKVESGEPSHAPPSPRTPSATPAAPPTIPELSPASATPSQRQWVSAATSANDSFEIRPAPKPDIETIPLGDLQARALASLRVNSRNSFLFIPKRKACGAPFPEGRQSEELPKGEVGWDSRDRELGPGGDGGPALQKSPLVEKQACPRPATALIDRADRWQRPSSPPPFLPVAVEAEPAESFRVPGLAKNDREHGRPGLPVTLIDEVDSEEEAPEEAKLPCSGVGVPLQYCPHPARPGHLLELQHRSINTFMVVPKRKPGALQEQCFGQANRDPPPQEEEEASCLGPQAAMGSTLKKRYPTVHEIEVIGGYLALQKSCLTKAGSSRKKMKISFNDKSLQTTFEYPSESSLVQEEEEEVGDEEDDEEEDNEEEEVSSSEEKPFALFLPRATFVSSVGPESPRLLEGSAGLSSYTPKHSVGYGKWQEQTPEQALSEVEPPPKEPMLTPASQKDLADFRSEPALHF